MAIQRDYTVGEEIANALTHGIGVGMGFSALTMLTIFSSEQHDPWKVVSSVLFGATIILMYLASTLYHSFPPSRTKRFFKLMDHASIYLLIAGSYTPFCLVTLRGGWGWSMFGLTWGLAILGVLFKMFFIDRFEILSTVIYVLIGWAAIIAIDPLFIRLPMGGFLWLLMGGLLYTIGVIFYVMDRRPYAHSIWHVFVLAGTLSHFFAVLFYVIL